MKRIIEDNPDLVDYSKEKNSVRVWLPERWYEPDFVRPTSTFIGDLYDIKGNPTGCADGSNTEATFVFKHMKDQEKYYDASVNGRYLFSKGSDPDYGTEVLNFDVVNSRYATPRWLRKFLYVETRGIRTVGQIRNLAAECRGILIFAQCFHYWREPLLEAYEGYWCGDQWADAILDTLEPFDDDDRLSRLKEDNYNLGVLWPPKPNETLLSVDYYSMKYVDFYKKFREYYEKKVYRLVANCEPSVEFREIKGCKHPCVSPLVTWNT